MIVVVLEKKDYMKWMDSKKMETFKDKYFAVAAPVMDVAPDAMVAGDSTLVVVQ
jgi:hypothetical protein